MRVRPRLLVLVLSFALANDFAAMVSAQEPDHPPGEVLRSGQTVRSLLSARASRLGTSAGPDPDTVYVGKSFTNHTAPDNYWNIYTGTYRPGTNDPNNALWDWENPVGIQAPDSLHGWWPYQREYLGTGGLTLPDDQRPWWCIDEGNVGNYVIPQGAAAKRTFGVVGYWHDDPGRNAGGGVMWSPLAGNRSAWCGMRQHGDLAVQDPATGNYYAGEAVAMYGESSGGGTGLLKRLPGYLNQMDQMLYRDIAVTPGQSLSVSFLYRTRMSISINTVASTRAGWFHGDPLAVVAGNFISSTAAGASAPQDSFLVYVGAPVDDAACVHSDGVTRPVYDPQRRWFSEVLKVFGPGASYVQTFGVAGNQPADTLSATPLASFTVPAATVSSILAASPDGTVRLVFRVKTNRTHSDADAASSGYSSLGRGAAQVDDVTIDRGAGPELIGDFETLQQGGVNAIDNRFPLPPGLDATQVWRSTGKPAPTYVHLEPLSNLVYEDLCGPPGSPARQCNLSGLVLVTGNHDLGETMADSRFPAFRETRTYIMSPTINLVGGPGGTPNSMGITSSIAHASLDHFIAYDFYWGFESFLFSGMTWGFGYQSYPTVQVGNGGKSWSDRKYFYNALFAAGPECFTDYEGFITSGFPLVTSNPSGIPDSLRILLGVETQCFRFNITLGCHSTAGAYFDNVSLAFVDQPGVPGHASAGSAVSLGTVSSDIWRFVNDTFPANETAGLPGTPAFDTTTALIRSGMNIAQATGNLLRFDIPGDSSIAFAGNATVSAPDDPTLATVRVDLVFRVLPGPGNYQLPPPIGPAAVAPHMVPGGTPVGTLLQTPTNQLAPAVSGDGSYWGQYMADPGLVSGGVHGPGNTWNPLVWNSCRMDTVQNNMFPVGGVVPTGTGLSQGQYMTCIHEGDPKFATLGVAKNRCFVVDTTKAATSSPTLANVVCDGTVPAWLTTVPQSRTGWDGSPTTKEFTKILPDGLLTPGSHVQYFYRKSHSIDPFLNFVMCPDTNFITPQARESSTDQHRWQQFGVLPDRWKSVTYGGQGAACLLYVDLNDRRGNEGRFVAIMDSIGATSAAKFGAHNGWHAPGTKNLTNLDVRTDLSVAVSDRNAQPGTSWDMYGVKSVESLTTSAGNLGSRLANRTNMGFAAGRESRQGPTPEMLRTHYRMVALLSGDLIGGLLGPFVNRSQDDISLLDDFLTAVGGTPQPRGIFVQGDGFVQGETAAGTINPTHAQFLADRLGVQLRARSYVNLSGNANPCADLLTTAALTPAADVYGVLSGPCLWSNDVFTPNSAIPEAAAAAFYENSGSNGPYVSEVLKTAVPVRNWVALTSGYDLEHLLGRFCDHTWGSWMYYYNAFNTVFGSLCQLTGACTPCLDTPQGGRGGPLVNFMKIGDALMRRGTSTVRLGIAQAGRVQVNVYDVAGRKVRTLADRVLPAGEQAFVWDGTDDGGRKLGRGVYFVRSSTQQDAGRIVVLER